MLSNIITFAVDFVRREDGRTAVEYAIVVNLIIIAALLGLSASGLNGRRAVTKISDGVSSAYHATHHTLYSLVRRTRNATSAHSPARAAGVAGANHAAWH